MPEILPEHVPSPRTLLAWDGTAFRPVTIDAAGHLQLDVLGNANLDDALQSVGTDRLIVRGEDQLFSITDAIAEYTTGVIGAGEDFFDSAIVPANERWVITNVRMEDSTSATTMHILALRRGIANNYFAQNVAAFAAGAASIWSGHLYMNPADRIRVVFAGSAPGDTCHVWVLGYAMTLEV